MLTLAGVKGGVVVQIGVDSGEDLADLLLSDRYLIQGLETDAEQVAKAKREIEAKGVYGKVSVVRFDGRKLPYTDNLVNLIVVRDENCEVPDEEIDRVLVPGGIVTAIDGNGNEENRNDQRSTRRKTVPDSIDSWPQYLHGADNNAVAKDRVVGPPRHL